MQFQNDFSKATIKSFGRRGIDIEKSTFPNMTLFLNKLTGKVEIKTPGDFRDDWGSV